MTQAPGIDDMALYVPRQRVRLEDWCAWREASWEKIRNLVGRSFRIAAADENVYTMAATAALRLIESSGVEVSRIGYFALGTESSSDNSAGAVIVRGLVDAGLRRRGQSPLPRDCEVPEFKQACLGGFYGLKGALRYLRTDGAKRAALVVCSDQALYLRNSPGEPTQGSGAVAMLLTECPRLLTLDLGVSAGTSLFRGLDFRKPVARFHFPPYGDGRPSSIDCPVVNGHYSADCFAVELVAVLETLAARAGRSLLELLRGSDAVFCHRPYRKLPIQTVALAYLCAIATDPDGAGALTDELITAGVHPAAIRACFSPVESAAGDSVWDTDTGALKAAWEAEKSLRSTPLLAGLQRKMRLGARDMEELGNLYTGSLFAWLAAGLCEAASDAESREGLRRILLIGYGSGNAAEALVGEVVPGWTHRAAQLGVSSALRDPRDVTRDEYEMLRRGELRASGRTGSYFVIDRIGDGRSGPFDDTGIEHYRYVVGSETN